jgi:TonB-linked SusC/RagA family outer membrane protein
MKQILLSAACWLLSLFMHAQPGLQQCKTLLRSALDASPVNGAVITVLPANRQTLSGQNGSFTISCSFATDTLLITHINFIPLRLPLNGMPSLPPVILLQPLVKDLAAVELSTGYQQLPKERATGSFETISNGLLNQQVSTNLLNRLETVANGLYLDKKTDQTTTNYTIRGLSTILGPKAPLIILDNFPYEGALANINPNDVENITLLKDAAAASIWGTRAGNGVIVITTKKAKFTQPLRIEFNNNISIAQKPELFYYNNISASGFIDLEQFLYSKGYYNSMISSSSKPVLTPVLELLVKKANGSIPAAQADAEINAMRSQDLRNEFNRYMYRTAVNEQHALTLKGGTENIAYLFSAGYDNNRGALDETYRRITLTSQNTYRLGSRLTLNAGINFTSSGAIAGKTGYDNITASNGRLPMYTLLADGQGNPIPVMKQYRQPYLDTAGGGKLLNWNYYPIDEHNHISNTSRISALTTNLGLTIRLTKGLTADIKYQYQRQSQDNTVIYDLQSFYARNLVNSYSQLNRATAVVTYKVPKGGVYSNAGSLLLVHNIRAQLNYTRSWKDHRLDAIAGTEVRQAVSNSSSFMAYGYNNSILTFGNVDYANTYPNYVNGSSSAIPGGISFSENRNRFISTYANAAFTLKNCYNLTLSGRRDASNLFGVNTNDKWTPLWSAGIGWNISKEKFYKLTSLPLLKLRATYGFSGNADPTRSGYTVLAYTINSAYTQMPTARIDQFTNPGLRWEKTATLNLGLDFRAFSNRLQGAVEYYVKKAKDLFGYEAVDYTNLPAYRIIKNAASIRGTGWDISLSSINIRKPFLWTTDINFNTNKDKVLSYMLINRSAANYLNGGLSISALEGRPVYAVYAYPWAGLDPQTGDPQGYLNGQVSKDYNALLGSTYPVDSLKYMGNAFPAFFGSLGNTVSYKGITLTARLSWKLGYYFLRNSVNYTNLFGSRQGHGDYSLRWQNPGDEIFTNIPSMVYPAVSRRDQFFNNAEILVERADHIRLQYITISYNLKEVFRKLPLEAINIYVNANNLGIIWRANKHGIDPDYRDNTILPAKNIALGLKVVF